MVKRLSRIFIIVFFINSSLIANSQVLNVPQLFQEHDQWCWAAVSKCIINYYGYNVSQCEIAEYTRLNATWHNFGSTNCCTNPNLGCNYWNYNYGTNGSIQNILQHWNIQNNGVAYYLSNYEIFQELSNHRPFLIRWGFTAGGGHFIVGHGLSGSTLYYMNPWPGEGLKMADYSWVVSSNDHTWTHTNVLTTYHSAINQNEHSANMVSVFPNPVNNELSVRINSDGMCEIKSLTGKTIRQYPLNKGNEHLDVSMLKKGFYILEIRTDNSISSHKFIKQ